MNPTMRRLSPAFFLLPLLFFGQAQAKDFNLGFVQIGRIVKESDSAKLIQTKLEREFSQREKDIAAQDISFKAAADKFKVEALTLPEAQRVSREQSLVEQDRDLQRKHRAFQEDLTVRKNEELQKLLASVKVVVKQLAIAEKLDLVVQEAVYINPKDDITDRVIKALNAQSVK